MDKLTALKTYFGYDSFREGQEELIDALCAGRDVFGIMPTGAGKSLCYQIPAVLLGGITLVVSPLISLMKDQVGALNQAGIRACYLNSSLSYRQYRLALQYAAEGKYRIAYVAPERLLTPEFLAFAQSADIRQLCVDEAHCVSQWGHDFRPAYLDIARFVELLPKRPTMAAFTATATRAVRKDILKLLGLTQPMLKTTGFDRKNLHFSVITPPDKYRALKRQIDRHAEEDSGIVYCLTRKAVEEVCEQLVADGYSATRYHAGLEDTERSQNQDDFRFDRKKIMVATNAFGMGIDKSNVRYVIHYHMPKNMESYYQEAGRAGRDGLPSDCVLLFAERDVAIGRFIIEHAGEDGEPRDSERVAQEIDLLMKMESYCKTTDCLRAYILRYFGEDAPEECGACSNCEGDFVVADVTDRAEKILGCVTTCRERFGAGVIADTVRGSSSQKLKLNRMDKNPYYAALCTETDEQIHALIDHLCVRGYLTRDTDGLPVLRLTARGTDVLNGIERVTMRTEKMPERPIARKSLRGTLFETLRVLRLELAKREFVPPYAVFSDNTLQQMSEKRPHDEEELLAISGVGQTKLKKYGKLFLDAIRNFEEEI
ncbi:MAG: DNA helicase RecQ [Clostridia bacterium]|nr:DNA helicase RecQ [Clostridia bacterium]